MIGGWDRAGEQQADEKHAEKSLCINCKSPRGFQMGRDTRGVNHMVDPHKSVARMSLPSLGNLKIRDHAIV